MFSRILEKYKCFNYNNVAIWLIIIPTLLELTSGSIDNILILLVSKLLVIICLSLLVLLNITLILWDAFIKLYKPNKAPGNIITKILPDPISWLCNLELLNEDTVNNYIRVVTL